MPNWCHAGFNVTGDHDELRGFAQMMLRPVETVGMIARIAPPPMADVGASEDKLTLDFNGIIPSPPADARVNWEAWAVENWGVKWNAQDVAVRVKPDNIWFQFSTPWEFPTPVFEALAAEFPTLVLAGPAYHDNDDLELVGEFNGDDFWGDRARSSGSSSTSTTMRMPRVMGRMICLSSLAAVASGTIGARQPAPAYRPRAMRRPSATVRAVSST